MNPLLRILLASLAFLSITQQVQAATIQYTYAWTASNIFDSNSNPPPNNLLTTSGTFTLAFDPEANPTLEDVPIIASTSFTDNEGVTLTSADIYSTVSVYIGGTANRTYRIFVGGIVTPLDKADESVGDTNDFRLYFDVWGGTGANSGEPKGLPSSPFATRPYSVSNGGFASLDGDLSVSLISATPVPLPAALPMFLSALALCGATGMRRRKR